jgi:glycosyltransferase involved in cell wall biosynthesis
MTNSDAHLTILVPARNAESSLPGWLASASTYADSVVALDDGSTDLTRSILEEHPLVAEVLTNPVRPSYHGWDDLENRQRLVDAARAHGADWLLFLDADECIATDDAVALRTFLATEALPGFAYGFEVFRMVDDDEHFDPHGMWVFRLFSAFDASVPLPTQRLHFVPVPSGIPMARWLQTSLRIQHAGSLTASHRRARFDKYVEADPSDEFHQDYENILADPALVQPWPARAPDVPVLLGVEGRYADRAFEISEFTGPAITAVVIAQNDAAVIERSIGALVGQEVDDEFEIVLAASGDDDTVERTRRAFPSVRCVQLPDKALPGEARNAGLWMARGEYVTFPGSHVWLGPGSLAARLRAHEEGWDMVTGSVVNGNPTPVGWASYFLDHSTQTPSSPSGEYVGAPGHASYVTRDVRAVGGFPEDMRAGEDTVVNNRLFFEGKRTFFSALATFTHASPSTTPARLVRHHFNRGRALGRMIRAHQTALSGFRDIASLPVWRLRTISGAMHEVDAEMHAHYRRVRGLVVAGALASGAGTWFELLTPKKRGHSNPEPRARIAATAPILVLSGRPGPAPTGLLGAGSAAQAANRLTTFARYARHASAVRPALAPIVTSASVTAEFVGTYTIDLPPPTVDAYLRTARRVDASLLLQVQPGRASLAELIDRWAPLLREPDVGIFFDVRPELAFAGQQCEIDEAIVHVRRVGGDSTMILVRGAHPATADVAVVDATIDLRQPGSLFPHEAFAEQPRPRVVVYH